MDVYPWTWPRRQLIADGTVFGPPHHGIGRGSKVGNKEITGLIAAVERYPNRDFDGEYTRWMVRLDKVTAALSGIAGIVATRIDPVPGSSPTPHLEIAVDAGVRNFTGDDLINALQEGDPVICTYESAADREMMTILPESLLEGDADTIGRRVREIVGARAGGRSTTQSPRARQAFGEGG